MSNIIEGIYSYKQGDVAKSESLTYTLRLVNAIDGTGLTKTDNFLSLLSKGFWIKNEGVKLTTVDMEFQQLDNLYVVDDTNRLQSMG